MRTCVGIWKIIQTREDCNPGRMKRKQFIEDLYSWPLHVCKFSHLWASLTLPIYTFWDIKGKEADHIFIHQYCYLYNKKEKLFLKKFVWSENSDFKPVKLRLKIDLVSYPAQTEGLDKWKCLWCNGYHRRKMDTATRVQILAEIDCISRSTNTLWKGMNPIILPPAMGK